MTDYIPVIFFPILYVAAKLVMRVHPVKAKEMDFITNVAEFDAMTYVVINDSCHTALILRTGTMIRHPGTCWRRSGCG